MEREQRAQHAETHEHQREPDALLGNGNVVQRGDLLNVHRRGARTEVDAQNADQQQRRTAHEHQRQLHGGVFLAPAAPDADQQVHRDQRHLVEQEYREEVDRNEEPEHPHAQQAEPEEVGFDVGLHLPRGERAREDDDGRQQEHRHRNAVDAHGVVDVERRIPDAAFGEEHLRRLARAAQPEVLHHEHDGQRHEQRRACDHHRVNLPRGLREPQTQHHHERNGGKQR